LEKKILIGIIVAVAVVVIVVAALDNHDGKTVDAPASSFMPDISAFPSGENWTNNGTSSDGATYTEGVVSYSQGTYVKNISGFTYTTTVKIYVFDTTENAKNAYSTTKASFIGTTTTNYGPFDQGFRHGDALGYGYVFQEMNVYMEIKFGSIQLDSDTKEILSSIEDKIHKAAK